MVGGVGGALVIAILIAAVVWYVRQQRRSAGDYESKTLPTTRPTIPSTTAPGASSSVVKVPRIVEAIMGRRTSVVKVERERKRDAKEEEEAGSVNEKKRAELLHERGKTQG